MKSEFEEITEEVWNKITNRKGTTSQQITSDHEFYYLAGQTVYYLQSKIEEH